MDTLSKLIQERLEVFLEDLLGAAGSLSRAASSPAAKIEIFDTIDKMIRRRRNEHTCFIQLPTDVVHLIFGMALNLDRIHDPDLSLDDLEEHRRNLLSMRCVSVAWNAFLLSRPEYWCVIDITATAPESVARAQQAPLCLYSKQGSGDGSHPSLELLSPILLGRATQVRTIRSDEENAYDFGIRMLRAGLPDLETLELTKATDWADMDEDSPSADALWLRNLRILVLKSPLDLNVHLLRVLTKCTNLAKLTLHADNGPDSAEEMNSAPSLISLPRLKEINMEVHMCSDVGYIAPILRFPDHSRRSLRIDDDVSFEVSPSDICQFLFPDPDGSPAPQETSLEIYDDPDSWPRVAYTAGTASLDLSPSLDDEKYGEFRTLIQAVQAHIKNPPVTLTLHNANKWGRFVWQGLGDVNVTKIWVKHMGRMGIVKILGILGGKHALPIPTSVEHKRGPFESLKELILGATELDPRHLTSMVEARHQDLLKPSKTWLTKITLISCFLYGIELDDAATELATMGVALIQC
ncbi:hypothetical protein FRC00_001515 [Tulasnella sp. 408]|nr:hypothetical protein FRC00_001515 [Tulasnella sp. 408]